MNAVLSKWRQENSERQGVKKRGRPSEARFLALVLTPLFLAISSAVLLRRTEPFSFATLRLIQKVRDFLGLGSQVHWTYSYFLLRQKKSWEKSKKLKKKSFCIPSTNPKSGDFLGLGSQVHWTYSYFRLWPKKSWNPFGKRKSLNTLCKEMLNNFLVLLALF